MFIHCEFERNVWREVRVSFQLNEVWDSSSFDLSLRSWVSNVPHFEEVYIFDINWGIWRSRNATIFDNVNSNVYVFSSSIVGVYNEFS